MCVIWTTTPWTLPANQALNLHPEFDYALVRTRARTRPTLLILASDRVEACLQPCGLQGEVDRHLQGSRRSSCVNFRHPFYERLAPVYLGEYVTLDTGTGIVHSSPAYGVEDFDSCKHYGMNDAEILQPVHGRRQLRASLELFGGQSIWEANPKIVDTIRARGTLFARGEVHAQLHALLAPQDAGDLPRVEPVVRRHGRHARTTAARRCARRRCRASRPPRSIPHWGKARLHGMIANRPDWTLSRQRQWGVPMAFFVHRETGELHPRTPELLEQVAKRIEHDGIEAWQRLDPAELLGADAGAVRQEPRHARRLVRLRHHAPDGAARLARGRSRTFPADMYLEGSDQHRGWFHSSLLTSSMLNGVPPYKSLLTHGFVVDGQGRKMSKSLGNTLAPQKISDTLGAEILRLWVASTDYSGELSISDEILKRVVEAYRRIRNTLRFLLANIADFDPQARRAADRRAVRDRPLRARADRAPGRRASRHDLRPLRVPPGGREAADLLLGGPGRVLPRHPQGPPVHDRRGQPRAALGADRAAPHHQRAAAR